MNKNIAKRINSVSKLEGSYTLRSGSKSNTYFDKYQFESNPELLKDIATLMLQLIPKGTDVLAGLEMGGVPLVTMLSQLTNLPCAFIRKKAKDYGTCRYSEGTNLLNKKIIIIEDVVSSGGAIIDAVLKLRADGIKVDTAICVIDRETGGKEKLKDIGINLLSLINKTELG
ncbi:MAG: orotate phosphoribosyltransferase [Spirochaetaceae bacterium]